MMVVVAWAGFRLAAREAGRQAASAVHPRQWVALLDDGGLGSGQFPQPCADYRLGGESRRKSDISGMMSGL